MTALALAGETPILDALRWHVVYTAPRMEWYVNRRLLDLGYRTVFLWRRDKVSHARRVTIVIRPQLPRYLFVGLHAEQDLDALRSTTGVATVLRGALGPLLVPIDVVDKLRAKGNADGLVAPPSEPPERTLLTPGTTVTITEGPFAGHQGRVAIDTGNQIGVTVQLFGRPTVAWLEPRAIAIDHPACFAMPQA